MGNVIKAMKHPHDKAFIESCSSRNIGLYVMRHPTEREFVVGFEVRNPETDPYQVADLGRPVFVYSMIHGAEGWRMVPSGKSIRHVPLPSQEDNTMLTRWHEKQSAVRLWDRLRAAGWEEWKP